MTVQIKNQYGRIDISKDALTTVIGNATTECYGVVGMASKNLVKDGLAVVLGKENYSKGVTLRVDEENKMIVDLYIIIGIGIKVTEVCNEVQKKVQYVTQKTFGEHVKEVNIFVQGVKGLDR
ncbi:MAG TPA: Asp23/Gls24 family envelope stress response protein [Firmicutes bacterium]|nr:Asp23/Gls24 family envelope stress response protein [Bacillota bacterium]